MPWNTLPVFSAGQVPNASGINDFIENLNYIKARDVLFFGRGDGLANVTTTSTTFAAIGSPYTYTTTMKTGYVLALFRAPTISCSVANVVDFTFAVDGTIIGATGTGIYRVPASQFRHVGMLRIIPVTAGSRTIDVRWRTGAGTATMHGVDRYPYFYLREISWTP